MSEGGSWRAQTHRKGRVREVTGLPSSTRERTHSKVRIIPGMHGTADRCRERESERERASRHRRSMP